MSKMRQSIPTATLAGVRRRLRFGVVVIAALVGGGIGGTGGFALAAGDWHGWHDAHRLEHVQAMLAHALDGVGATTAQEAKVHDIVASAATAMMGDKASHAAMRQQMIALLRAPTIDRDAVEKLRTQQVAAFDARSKTFTSAILDAAAELNPAQRSQLADRAEHMMAHHGGHGGEHGDRGHDGQGGDTTGDDPRSGPDKG